MGDEKRKTYSISLIPKNEIPCRWMEAGVLTYKLCDMGMECSLCPLDHVLSGKLGGNALAGKSRKKDLSCIFNSLSHCHLDTRRQYHPGHIWMTPVDSQDAVQLGLNHIVAGMLGSVDGIRMPALGEMIFQDMPFGEVVQEGKAFPLAAPLTGEVIGLNEGLVESPERLMEDPLGEGWLLRVAAEDFKRDSKKCRTGMSVVAWTLVVMESVKSYVTSVAGDVPRKLGSTMFDGGEIRGNLKENLPVGVFRHLIESLLKGAELTDL